MLHSCDVIHEQCDQKEIAKCLYKLPKIILLEKWLILTPLQKLPKNVGDLGKLIVAKGFEKLPKVQYIAQSGHTDNEKTFITLHLPSYLHKFKLKLCQIVFITSCCFFLWLPLGLN